MNCITIRYNASSKTETGEHNTTKLCDVINQAHVNLAFEDDVGPALEPSYPTNDFSQSGNTLEIPSLGSLDRLKSSSDPALHRTEDGTLTPRSERFVSGILKNPKVIALQKILTATSSPDHKVSGMRRHSSIAMEMLMEVQDRDAHPFGRGGMYEGVLKEADEDLDLNTSKAMAWIILCGCISFLSFGIVLLAELERQNYNTTGELKEKKTIWAMLGFQ